ncbi:MAG: hypothetical protein WCF23_18435 [Candidatus Nitrosopolaris sp.]
MTTGRWDNQTEEDRHRRAGHIPALCKKCGYIWQWFSPDSELAKMSKGQPWYRDGCSKCKGDSN